MLLPRLMSHLTSPHHWGSELIPLGASRPLRPFHLALRCKIFVTLRDGPPLLPSSGSIALTFKQLPAFQFSLPRLVPYTLGRDLSVWWRGHVVPKVFDAAWSSRKGTSQVTYVTLVPWGNEMLRRRPYFLHPCGRLLHSKLPLPLPQVLFYFLVATSSPPVTSAGIPLDEITDIFQSVRTNRRSQSVQRSFSYIRNLGRSRSHGNRKLTIFVLLQIIQRSINMILFCGYKNRPKPFSSLSNDLKCIV